MASNIVSIEMTSRRVLVKIEELEKQLAELKLELKKTAEPRKPDKLTVGDRVNILNPSRGQVRTGIVCKVNHITGRATVETTKGKVSRALKNLETRDRKPQA